MASRTRAVTFFPKQFTVGGSQCFKEWSPWCWMVWSGSRPACLPLPFICLPVLFICLPGWVLVVGFPAGLSPTSFHLSPTSFQLSPSSFHLSPRLGACGRVPGWLVSHFLSFVSQFFSFVSQATSFHLSPTSFHCLPGWCLWSGSRPACLPLPFICLPLLFICLPGWVVGFPAGLSPTSFHLSPTSFLLVVGFPAALSPTSSYLSPTSFHLSPRLGACGRVPGRLVSHLLSFVSRFFSFFVGFPAGLSPTSLNVSPTSFHLSLRLGACGPVPGWLVSHFLAFLPFPFICLPLLFICLPGWVLVARFPGGLSPTSLHLSSTFSPNSLLLGVLNSFLRRVRPLCHCWCPPISTGHVTFLFIRLPGLSLLVPALFRWPCSISIHVSPRSVTDGVRPFPLVA